VPTPHHGGARVTARYAPAARGNVPPTPERAPDLILHRGTRASRETRDDLVG
jgi:hypothetical protein